MQGTRKPVSLGALCVVAAMCIGRTGLAASEPPIVEKPVPPEVVQWVRDNAIPLRCCDPSCGVADLRPLSRVIGDARVVAAGEATHGTSEFFRFKHKLLQYLVEEKGFNVFGIEASFAEALVINRYILTGQGNPAEALAGLHFFVWDTEEVLRMIQWMRLYNADPLHKTKLSFYGFDMQYTQSALKDVLSYFDKVSPAKVEPLRHGLSQLDDPASRFRLPKAPASERDKCLNAVQAMLDDLRLHKEDYVRKSDLNGWELAVQEATVLQQALNYYFAQSDPDIRDKAMADNVMWILHRGGPQAKLMVWAHNAHVSFGSDEGGGPKTGTYKLMGAYLKERLGDALIVFGVAFDHGSFNAIDRSTLNKEATLRQYSVGRSPKGTLPSALSRAGIPNFILDLRTLPHSGPAWEWWQTPHWYRRVSSVYTDKGNSWRFGWERNDITKEFDALVFFANTTAAHPTATGTRPRKKP